MAAQRPRLSVLTLFDPLSSSSSDSLDSDKENECGDSSFFHPHGLSMQPYSPVRRLRRRLVDVGDMTVEEPDIRDLIEEELEAEISQSVALEDDENATLTFRDMAKAATPKWSGKRATRKGSPTALSSPRTPLAEIVSRDEITPLARKKIFKRPTATSVPKTLPLNAVHTVATVPTLIIHDLDNNSGNPVSATFSPGAEIFGGGTEMTKNSSSPNSMGTSTATLELPISTGPLISDTPIPLFISPSLESSYASHAPSRLTESRLRPNTHMNNSNNRYSVDLHASFQLHLSSSETTFDLLNDKISFLGSKSGLEESFLDSEGVSFGDKGEFGAINDDVSSKINDPETELNIRKVDASTTIFGEHVHEPALDDIIDRHASLLERSGIPSWPGGKKGSDGVQTVNIVPGSSTNSEATSSVLSTPNPPHPVLRPPRAVAALRIAKRSKGLEEVKAAKGSDISEKPSNNSASRAPKRTWLGSILTGNGIENGGRMVNRGADGPRRVLVREGAVGQDSASGTSERAMNGPRRVPGVSTSGIPKPVKSRIPAPNGQQRFGVQIKGLRVAGK